MSASLANFPSTASRGDMINIRRDVKDPFYRYKMPRVLSKIEGKGNGIKTLVTNMADVAKALCRPPTIVTKYFGGEFGSIVHCDDKAQRYIVNGVHEGDKLQSTLDGFISKFVLCGECDNPETDLIVENANARDAMIWKQCKACGQRTKVDMTHKLIPYILKNPPPQPRKIKEKQAPGEGDEAAEAAEEQEEGMQVDESEFASLHNVKSTLDDSWADEDAKAIREAELEGLSSAVKSSLSLKPHEAEGPGSLEDFANWLKTNSEASTDRIVEEVNKRKNALESNMAIVVVVQTLFDVETALAEYQKRLDLLENLVNSESDQLSFLYSMERLVGVHRTNLLPNLPAMFQAAFNAEIIDEESINAWNEKISKRYVSKEIGQKVRKVCQQFVDWVNQSDEEEEDSESEAEKLNVDEI
jgi:translation initiation factor 5